MYYSILEVTPSNDDWVENYVSKGAAVLAKHGGVYLARTDNYEFLEGQGKEAALRVIIQWPSRQSALDFMADPEYSQLFNARRLGAYSDHVLVEGKDMFAKM